MLWNLIHLHVQLDFYLRVTSPYRAHRFQASPDLRLIFPQVLTSNIILLTHAKRCTAGHIKGTRCDMVSSMGVEGTIIKLPATELNSEGNSELRELEEV